MNASPQTVVRQFFESWEAGDIEAATALADPAAPVRFTPAGIEGTFGAEGRDFLYETFTAFPDLQLTVLNQFASVDRVVTRLTFEGTQATPYLGVVNQEKHLDLEQAWVHDVVDGRITGVTGYWCQNQLYRRLAVKRLDQLAIV